MGYFLDQKWQSQPWGLIIGLVVGCAGSIAILRELAQRMDKEDEEENTSEN